MTVVISAIAAVVLAVSSAQSSPALKGLTANGPLPALAHKMMLFAPFVGDWEVDATVHRPNGSTLKGTGEWHWGWILGGRALQDVYILRSAATKEVIVTGAAIRFPEAGSNRWRMVYAGPMSDAVYTFTARQIGDEIVMEGTENDGSPMRWIISQVTPQSFRWRAVVSPDSGKTWQLRMEMVLHRAAAPS